MSQFSNTLIQWYLQNKRELPWRNTTDPYFIWLSEIILQQTRVNQGLPYYLKFTERFPTIFNLAEAEIDEVLKLWQGLGYYSRARNLHHTAKFIATELNGQFPSTFKELMKLKGVGDYTASAIASICYNAPTAVVDGNVYRVLARYFGIDTAINSSSGIALFKALSQDLIDIKRPAEYNQATMEFGATLCTPKNPSCQSCPLANSCSAHANNSIHLLPVKIKKIKTKIRHFNFLVIQDANGQVLLDKRMHKDIWHGLHQFPLIESTEEYQLKDLRKEPNLKDYNIRQKDEIQLFNQTPIKHLLSHQTIFAKFWLIKLDRTLLAGVKWAHIDHFAVPKLIDNFIKKYKINA